MVSEDFEGAVLLLQSSVGFEIELRLPKITGRETFHQQATAVGSHRSRRGAIQVVVAGRRSGAAAGRGDSNKDGDDAAKEFESGLKPTEYVVAACLVAGQPHASQGC
jgi:hypothetical protein